MQTIETNNISLFNFSNKQYYLLIIIGIFGILIRLIHYFYNRSLWGDEAFLCINFLGDTWTNLLHPPLLYSQQAPFGFLLIEKALVSIFGPSEYILRLFSLLSSIGSIFLFIHLIYHYLNQYGRILSLSIIVLSFSAVYHSIEAKQYSIELFTSIILYLSFLKYGNKSNMADICLFGIIGAIVTWFSYSSIFILATFACLIFIKLISHKEWKRLFFYSFAFLFWLISLIPNYIYFIKPGSSIPWLVSMWEGSFMPVSGKIFVWLIRVAISIMKDPIGISWSQGRTLFIVSGAIIGLGLLLIGVLTLLKKDKESLFLFFFPLFLALLASSVKAYPFHGRFLLFTLPALALLIGKGFEKLAKTFYEKPIYIYVILFIVLIPPLFNTFQHIVFPDQFTIHSDYRSGVVFIANHNKQDSIYIPIVTGMSSVEAGFNFYNRVNQYNLKYDFLTNQTVSADTREQLISKFSHIFERLKKRKSIWLVTNPVISAKIEHNKLNHIYESETDILLEVIKSIGGKVDLQMRCKTIATYHILF